MLCLVEDFTYSSPGHNDDLGQGNGLNNRPFHFLDSHVVTSWTHMKRKYIYYRPPRLVKGKHNWYISYQYRVPTALKAEYKNRTFHRFRVYEDLNRYKTDEYASMLLKAVEEALESGYNPFKYELEYTEPVLKIPDWSLNVALDYFIGYSEQKGLRKKTIQSYSIVINFLKDYFIKDNQIYKPLTYFTKQVIRDFLQICKIKKKWNNHTYNNYLSYTSTIFNWFVREDKIDKNPCVGIETLPVTVTKHRYYDDKTMNDLKEILTKENPYLWEFFLFIYYTCTRPKSEARLLQNKHILFDRRLLFIPAHISKTKTDRTIPLGDEILRMLENRKEQPKEYYIFGGEKPHSQNHMALLFKPYKNKLGLGVDFTLYGAKHSRIIHLKTDGVSDADIMSLSGHTTYDSYSRYLRDLSLTVNAENLNTKSRKF